MNNQNSHAMKKDFYSLVFSLILLLLMPVLASCDAIKRLVYNNKPVDTTYIIHYDTVPVPRYDTVKTYTSKEFRDTIPIFKGTKIFMGSSIDSTSSDDSVRYYAFEIFNYGDTDYEPTDNWFYNMHFDLEINNIIMRRDTIKLENIQSHGSRNYLLRFPVKWFEEKLKKQADYHYRITIKDNTEKIIDAWFPRPINNKLPEKRWDEVTKDSIIYWVRPVVIDTNVIIKRPVFAYRDSLIFIDDIIGCQIYSHIFFGGNKIYSFVADTCTKRLYSGTGMTDNNTEGISALIVKSSTVDSGARLIIAVNDSVMDAIDFKQTDSIYVFLVKKSFRDIKTVTFQSASNIKIHAALLNNHNLLDETADITGTIQKDGAGYIYMPRVSSSLIAHWRFNNNTNDETGNYPITLKTPGTFGTSGAAEGTGYFNGNGSEYYATTAPLSKISNQFTMTGWIRSRNEGSDRRAILSNGNYYTPNGFVLFLDEINKGLRFATGDGQARVDAFTNSGMYTAGQWFFFAIEVDKVVGLCKMRINGTSYSIKSNTVLKNFKTNLPLYIGRAQNGWQGWCGIDDLRIYNKILSQAEIDIIFNKGNIIDTGYLDNTLKINLP